MTFLGVSSLGRHRWSDPSSWMLRISGSPHWCYVWPRDSGYLAVAFSLIGRHRQAREVLYYVASVQDPDGDAAQRNSQGLLIEVPHPEAC